MHKRSPNCAIMETADMCSSMGQGALLQLYETDTTHIDNPDSSKCMGVIDTVEKAMADRTNSHVLKMMGGDQFTEISDEDSDVKSDAGTSCLHAVDVVEVFADEEGCVDDILCAESTVKKKLDLLAEMVGIDCNNPVVVLAEVVRVLRDLEQETKGVELFRKDLGLRVCGESP